MKESEKGWSEAGGEAERQQGQMESGLAGQGALSEVGTSRGLELGTHVVAGSLWRPY